MRLVAIAAVCIAAGCSSGPVTSRCEALCQRVGSCVKEVEEAAPAPKTECLRACGMFEREREASARVDEASACVEEADSCRAVLACIDDT